MESKQAILASSLRFEKEFKETQNRLSIYSDLTSYELSKASLANTISTLLPPDIFLTSVVFNAENVGVSGISPNERSIQQLLVNLSSKELFKEAQLVEVGSSENDSSLLKFTIKVVLENGTQNL